MELPVDAADDFETVVRRILPAHLPTFLTTRHGDDGAAAIEPALWIGNDVYGDAPRAYRVAHILEAGGKWLSTQHGGGYGQILEVGHGAVEYETADGFMTWGWMDAADSRPPFYPLPSPALSQLPRHREATSRLVFVGTMVPAYHYRFHTVLQPEQILDTLDWRRRFLSRVAPEIRAETLYRPYIHDYGVDEVDSVVGAGTECGVLRSGSLTDALAGARLVVVDHVATTLLESLAMNVPTVLFWDPKVYVVHTNAVGYFDELRGVGILHDRPEEAADRVNSVWIDVAGWWQRKEVQSVRGRFVERFARCSKTWRQEWIGFIKKQLGDTTPAVGQTLTTSRHAPS